MGKILVILPNNPGDILMATPALRVLGREHRVHFLADSEGADLVRANPHLAAVHVFPRLRLKQALREGSGAAGWAGLREFAAALKRENFGRVINFYQSGLYAYLAAYLGCPDTVGASFSAAGAPVVQGAALKVLASLPFCRDRLPAHAGDLYTLAAGGGPDGRPAELRLTPADEEGASRAAGGLNGGARAVALHPFSAHGKKRWPPEFFRALAGFLLRQGWAVFATGAPAEAAAAAVLFRGLPVRVLAGALSFTECGALYRRCAAVVAGDTVALHLAAAVGTRAVGLFGPTHPAETGPLGPGHALFHVECSCQGLYSGPCLAGEHCHRAVPAEAVAAAVAGHGLSPLPGVTVYTTGYREEGFLDLRDAAGHSAYDPAAWAWLLAACGWEIPAAARGAPSSAHEPRLRDLVRRRLANLEEIQRRVAARQPAKDLLQTERELDIEGRSGLDEFCQMMHHFLSLSLEGITETDAPSILRRTAEELRNFQGILDRSGWHGAPPPPAGLPVAVIDVSEGDTFSQAANRGAAPAAAEFLLFQPAGAAAAPDGLRYLVRALRRHPEAAAAGPRLLREDLTVRAAGLAFRPGRVNPEPVLAGAPRFDPRALQPRFCPALPAAGLLVRRAAFAAAGGFDESYRTDLAGADLCLALQKAGGKCFYEPRAEYVCREAGPPEAAAEADGRLFARKWSGAIVPDWDGTMRVLTE